jgi:hypothetical protein
MRGTGPQKLNSSVSTLQTAPAMADSPRRAYDRRLLGIAPARGGLARQIASDLGGSVSPHAFAGYTKGNPQPYLFLLNV